MFYRTGTLIGATLVATMLAFSPASALVIGAGQSATVDFDFSASQATIDASPQPLTLTFEMTTSVADQFDDPAGMFSFQYLDIGTVPTVTLGYDATGGVTSLGLISFSITTTDLVGSLRLTMLTESIDLVGVTFGAQDFEANLVIATTGLSLPNSVDVQIPEPETVALFGLGLLGLGYAKRLRR